MGERKDGRVTDGRWIDGSRVSQEHGLCSPAYCGDSTFISCLDWYLTLMTRSEKMTALTTNWDLAGCPQGLRDWQARTRRASEGDWRFSDTGLSETGS